jgi:hypothetical protein
MLSTTLNIELNITAAPELLAVLSNFTNSIISAKVATVPQTSPRYTSSKAVLEQSDAEAAYNQSASNTYTSQEPVAQQMVSAQQPILNHAHANVNPAYNQGNTTPVNSINYQQISVPVNVVQAHQQAPVQAPAAQTPIVPTASQTYTMEQLAVAATQLVDAGRRTELVSLLQTFGVQALTALPKEQYGAFATQLRALGAKI